LLERLTTGRSTCQEQLGEPTADERRLHLNPSPSTAERKKEKRREMMKCTVRRAAIEVEASRCGNGGWNVGKFDRWVVWFGRKFGGERHPTTVKPTQ
jgi:hypothetical protein